MLATHSRQYKKKFVVGHAVTSSRSFWKNAPLQQWRVRMSRVRRPFLCIYEIYFVMKVSYGDYNIASVVVTDLYAKYNCTYCQEDITGLRIKCVECQDFDLCLQVSWSYAICKKKLILYVTWPLTLPHPPFVWVVLLLFSFSNKFMKSFPNFLNFLLISMSLWSKFINRNYWCEMNSLSSARESEWESQALYLSTKMFLCSCSVSQLERRSDNTKMTMHTSLW